MHYMSHEIYLTYCPLASELSPKCIGQQSIDRHKWYSSRPDLYQPCTENKSLSKHSIECNDLGSIRTVTY